MTPTLRKLYHRRGKHLDCIAEIDRQIEELTPDMGDLVLIFYIGRLRIGVFFGKITSCGNSLIYLGDSLFAEFERCSYLTILEKGFER